MPAASIPPWGLGQRVAGRYEVTRRIDAGAMGEVWAAHDTLRDRPVALKRLTGVDPRSPDHAEAVERLRREAVFTSQLRHPGIVEVYDLAVEGAEPVLVMELLSGVTLEEHLRVAHHLAEDIAVEWMSQVLDALAAAHAAGVLHRDLKPANVFLAADPGARFGARVKLFDFGLSKALPRGDDSDRTELTLHNVFLGSLRYASPEQLDGNRPLDPRSDLYAVGVMLFGALTGSHPAGSDKPNDIVLRSLSGNVERSPRALRPAVSPSLDAVTQRALAHAPEGRYGSAAEMAAALRGAGEQTTSTSGVKTKTAGAPWWLLVLVALAGGAGWAMWALR